ncbi:hypothetical protein [Erythrobacter aureus]|uniref:Uncharacterized protein n=1 Tax=Erythrobacter aureus TaxID=2182384 RepID=A0A345YJL1_9SPHN|nr:hypothetical protein [Erythrobacter aureus]AXK44113.1 hypothetical protein DVR09_16810 [Erythrobacter aureus]
MSSVLVGIIAVILFIGLAIVSSLYLGGQFNTASAKSQALEMTNKASQLNQATALYWTEQGRPVVARSSVRSLLEKGYLKKVPVNPYIDRGGAPFRMLFSGDVYSANYYADVIIVDMGQDEDAKEVCSAINRQASHSGTIPEIDVSEGARVSAMTEAPTGCFQMHDVGIYGEAGPHSYIMYSRL